MQKTTPSFIIKFIKRNGGRCQAIAVILVYREKVNWSSEIEWTLLLLDFEQ